MTEPYLLVFKKSVIISLMNRQKIVWNMQKFQFPLLTYELDSTVFRKEVARDVVRTALCVVIFKTGILNAQSHFTITALPEHFFCHTSSLTDTTPQLRLRRGGPIFAAADFKPSDTLFNFRWST